MRTNLVKGGKVLTTTRRSSGRRNHNLRHKNIPPHNKAVLLPTRRETMKRRKKKIVHIARNQIIMSIIARLIETMSWKIYSRRTKFKYQMLPRVQLQPLQKEKGKHLWQIQVLHRNGFLTQVPHIIWVLQRETFLHWRNHRYHSSL